MVLFLYLHGFKRDVVFLPLGRIDGGKRVLRISRYDLPMRAVNGKNTNFERLKCFLQPQWRFELDVDNNARRGSREISIVAASGV